MKKIKILIKEIFLSVFIVWVLFLPLRSLVYIIRIIKEFIYPPQNIFQDILPCQKNQGFKSIEEQRIYQYKRLGIICEK